MWSAGALKVPPPRGGVSGGGNVDRKSLHKKKQPVRLSFFCGETEIPLRGISIRSRGGAEIRNGIRSLRSLCAFPLPTPYEKQVFDGLAIKKAPQLRCDAIP